MSRDARQEYWSEAIGQALCELDKFNLFTAEEIDDLGKSLAGAAECESMAFGWDVASANLAASRRRETDDLRRELKREQTKVACRQCNGHGRLRYNAGPWAVDTQCDKCGGYGRHDP